MMAGESMSRRRIATLILLEMMNSKGSRRDKVLAAVDYTDELLKELKSGRSRDERSARGHDATDNDGQEDEAAAED